MFSLHGYTNLPGAYGARCQSHLDRHTCIFRQFRTVAIIPKYGRRPLPIFAAKFTVNADQSSINQQVVKTIPTGPPNLPNQTGPHGLLPVLAGGLVALTGIVAIIRAAATPVKSAASAEQPGDGRTTAQAVSDVDSHAGAQEASQALASGGAVGATVASGNAATTNPAGGQKAPGAHNQGENLGGAPATAVAAAVSVAVMTSDAGSGSSSSSSSGGGVLQGSQSQQQRQMELERARTRQSTSELQRELKEVEQELLKAQREGASEVAGARVELKESRRKADLLEAMVIALRERLRREEDRNAALEVEVESGRVGIARLGQLRQELEERIEALRMELADTQAKLLVAQARAAELDARLAHLVTQNKELELRVGELEGQLQTRTAMVASAASSAEDKLRLMQAAADEDRLHIAKLQAQIADREAQLKLLREGESELQEVLQQSKAAAAQMSELLRQRDVELQRLQGALRAAEERRLEEEKASKAKVAALQQEREPVLRRLQEAVKEAEARRLEEAAAMKSKLEELRRLHEERLRQLEEAGGAAGLAAQAEVAALREELSGLQAEREKEVTLLNSQLQESARHAEQLREAAKSQAAAQEAEVQALQKELEDAKLRAEQSSARRVAEVSELRSALDQQLGAARQEALDARAQLVTVKEQLDGVLSEEFLQLLEDELRRSVMPGSGAQPSPRARALGSPVTLQELRGLESREAALRRQIELLSAELAELQSGAVARLGPALVARAQDLEAAAAQSRKALRPREAVGDQPGIKRITQQLNTLNSELAALYSSVMLPEVRNRERAVRLQMQDCEAELRRVVEEQIRLQDRLELERKEAEERREKAVAAASGPTQQQLQKSVQSRVKELLKEREQQVQQQAAAREKQLQAQLKVAQAGSEAQQRELRAVQEAMEKQARLMEDSWKLQVEASSRALQEAAADKQRLAAEVNRSTVQVRQQLAELESLRRELLAARSTVESLRRVAENSRANAAQQSVGAAQEVRRLAAQVQQLQYTLKERERQYAASSNKASVQATQPQVVTATRAAPSSLRPVAPAASTGLAQPAPLMPSMQLSSSQPQPSGPAPATARVSTTMDTIINTREIKATATNLVTGTAAAARGTVQSADAADGNVVTPRGSGAVSDLKPGTASSGGGNSGGFKPLTPLRPGWPAQYGGAESQPSPESQPPPPAMATAKTGGATEVQLKQAVVQTTARPQKVSGVGKDAASGSGREYSSSANGSARMNGYGPGPGAVAAVNAASAKPSAGGHGSNNGKGNGVGLGRGTDTNGTDTGTDNDDVNSSMFKRMSAESSPATASSPPTVASSPPTVAVPQSAAAPRHANPAPPHQVAHVGNPKTASSVTIEIKPADDLVPSASAQLTAPARAFQALSSAASRQQHQHQHQQQQSDMVPPAGSVGQAQPLMETELGGGEGGAGLADNRGGQNGDGIRSQRRQKEEQLSSSSAGSSGRSESSLDGSSGVQVQVRQAERSTVSQRGSPITTTNSDPEGRQSSQLPARPEQQELEQQQKQQMPRGVRGQALRRSVPPGPFDSTSLPAAAATPEPSLLPPTSSTPSTTDFHAQQAPQPSQQLPPAVDSVSPVTAAPTSAPAAAIRGGGGGPSRDAALLQTTSPPSSPSPGSSSSASASASPFVISARSVTSNATSTSENAALTTPTPTPSPLPMASPQPRMSATSGAVFINPKIGQSAPSPPPIKPLTPLKVPTPENFADFKQSSPAAPAASTTPLPSTTSSASSASSASPKVSPFSQAPPVQKQTRQDSASALPPPSAGAAMPMSPSPSPSTSTSPSSSSTPPPSSGSRSANQATKTKAPQSPAAAAMAAAAGAAEAARRAAAAAAAGTPQPPKTPSPPGFNTPPITEWGRPKPPPETADGSVANKNNNTSASSGRLQGQGSETSSFKPVEGISAPFFSDAELGAEIAAIAQSLVQRTIGGGSNTSATSNSARSTQPSSTPAPVSTREAQAPSAAPATIGRDIAPTASAAGAAEAIRLGSMSMAAALSGPASSTSRRLQLSVAAYGVPHVAKAEKGSEDAYFLLTPSGGVVTSGGATEGRTSAAAGMVGISALGVADGVGGWVEANVDPAQYSREVMDVAARVAVERGPEADPRQLLAEAQDAVRTIGSCTACVAVLSNKKPATGDKALSGNPPYLVGASRSGGEQVLTIANLGDSGCRVVRRGSLILATSVQEHQFNMPYQMAHPDNLPETDTAADAQMYQLALEPGDVVVLATDGLFDNMWDEELVSMVASAATAIPPGLAGPAAAAAAQPAAQQLASSLVATAFRHAQDRGFRSPWAVELANQPSASWISRLIPRGGKMDDITAVVAIVTAA